MRSGPGFALTEDRRGVLHLGLDAGAGFDTNPYSQPLEAQATTGDLTVRIRPNVEADYPGSTIAFRGVGQVDFGFLPGVIDPATQNYLLYQALAAVDAELNRGGAVSVAAGNAFSWNNDPSNVTVGQTFNRINNQARAGVGFKPGGGALQLRLGYTFDLTRYLDIEGLGGPIARGALDSMTHGIQLRTDYKFLPKTGFFGVVSAGWFIPVDETVNPEGFPVSATLGVQGQVLHRLSGLASIGYSNPLIYDDTLGEIVSGNLVGLSGQLEAQWNPVEDTRIAGGFQRTFQPAPLYQYVGNNRFYVAVNQAIARRLVFGLMAGYSILEFGEEQLIDGRNLTSATDDRLDGHLDANAQIAVFFTEWFSLAIADRFNWRMTNANDATGPGAINLSFVRNETFLLASVRY